MAGAAERWLDAYGRAWETRDPDAAAALFTPHGTYAWGPFGEPLRGREQIRAAWSEATSGQRDVRFGYELLGEVEQGAVARWWCSFEVPDAGTRSDIEGIFLVRLDNEGACEQFREWYNGRVVPEA